jgi:hypothetical protein
VPTCGNLLPTGDTDGNPTGVPGMTVLLVPAAVPVWADAHPVVAKNVTATHRAA